MFRIDETDPRYLIAYEEVHEHSVAPYQDLMRRWVERAQRDDPFGVVLVHMDHDHDEDDHHDEPYVRDVAFEEAFTRLLNDFRRDHKSMVERCTAGYVRIFSPRWMNAQIAANPRYIDELRASQDRFSRYTYGVPAHVVLTVDEARAWIDAQIAAFAPPAALPVADMPARRVGLFYGSTTGVTELMALAIAQAWEAQGLEPITAVNIGMVKDLSRLQKYDCLILGVPTWNVGQLQDDWEIALPQLASLDLTGRKVALFGVGDQYNYADNFLDAVGIMGAQLVERGAQLVGRWSAEGYAFSDSKALVDGQFMGLALDEVHQPGLSAGRIDRWVAQIAGEFALQPVAREGV